MPRIRERLSTFLTHDALPQGSSVPGFFLKIACDDGTYIREIAKEFKGYEVLSPYFHMPKVKMAQTKEGSILVILEIKAQAANTLFESNPDMAATALEAFLTDLEQMWKKTICIMDKSQVTRDWKHETLSTLTRLLESPCIKQIEDMPVLVNGTKYPTVGETLKYCQYHLSLSNDPNMALCHGDEHLGNILASPNEYWLLDPGNYTGFNSPASAVNNMVGGTYLFDYRYDGCVHKDNTKLRVDFKIRDPFQKAENVLRPSFSRLYKIALDASGGCSSAKELLFINEMRVALGWTKRAMDAKGFADIIRTGMVYIGPAMEHFYSNDIV